MPRREHSPDFVVVQGDFRMLSRKFALPVCLAAALMVLSTAVHAQYKLTNLVSNQFGAAHHDDPLLVNAWGLTYGPGSPFWISDNKTGWSTLYNGAGVPQSLQVIVPSASGRGPGSPTGIVFNGSSDFKIKSQSTFFLFATLDGTISGWAPKANIAEAMIVVDNSKSGASYTGLAITSNASGNLLFAADAVNNKVDVYDGTFKLVKSFTDKSLPPNFTYSASRTSATLCMSRLRDINGGPGGSINMYTEDGTFIKHLVQGKPLNQPWGLAAAPGNFGPLSNTLLVSNNTNTGTINAFDGITDKFVGVVRDQAGKPIQIDQLWGIEFGGGTANNGATNQLFFTAGPDNNFAGTFGVIDFK
jgi:uncharacterized protein (TIGR03118 family)